MFQCSDCRQEISTYSDKCVQCGGKPSETDIEQRLLDMRSLEVGWNGDDALPPSEDAIRRAEIYISCHCSTYRPDLVAPSQAGGNCYGSVCLTWMGTHNRRAYMEFYDSSGVQLMLSSRASSRVLDYMSEHNGDAIHVIQSFLHGD